MALEKKKYQKHPWLRKSAKVMAAMSTVSVMLYMAAGFSIDPGFFARDAQSKVGKVLGATTLRIRLIGVPEKPVVTAIGACKNGSPVVNLAWNAATDADYYDIDRDSSPLVSGVPQASYQDAAVQAQTTYSYQVTAVGPAGSSVSDPVSATTPDNCIVIPPPDVQITTLENKALDEYGNTLATSDRFPSFSGTTNIPDALVHIYLYSQPVIALDIVANDNGFWSFQTPVELLPGLHTLIVTATDPNDATRTDTDTLNFTVTSTSVQKSSSENENNNHKTTAVPAVKKPSNNIVPEIKMPFSLTITVENSGHNVYPGQDLISRLQIKKLADFPPAMRNVHYQVFDPSGRIVLETTDQQFIQGDQQIFKNIRLPALLSKGSYKISADVNFNGTIISAQDSFNVQEQPLYRTGAGTTVTMTGLMQQLGWIIYALLLLLLIFLLMLLIEHHLSTRALFHITEKMLRKKGLLGKERRTSK